MKNFSDLLQRNMFTRLHIHPLPHHRSRYMAVNANYTLYSAIYQIAFDRLLKAAPIVHSFALVFVPLSLAKTGCFAPVAASLLFFAENRLLLVVLLGLLGRKQMPASQALVFVPRYQKGTP